MGVFDRFRLDGRRALITGGSRGLGLAMARALAEAGAELVLVGRDPAALQAAAGELSGAGRRVDVLPGDLGNPADAERVCEAAVNRHGPIDVLINNVGGRRISVPTEELALDDWRRVLDLNLTSAFVCTRRLGGAMLPRRWGRVINIDSICGQVATRGIRGRHYETAKAALVGFTRAVAADWAPHGVTVNAIAPGVFGTDPNRRWFVAKPEFERTFLDHIPMGRLGEPDELGPAAVFLAGDASSYVTGATIVVDGGFTLW